MDFLRRADFSVGPPTTRITTHTVLGPDGFAAGEKEKK